MGTIQERVVMIIGREMGIEESTITLESKLREDLGVDSLDEVELQMDLKDEFEIEIPDDDVKKVTTVGEVVDYITKKLER